ncbi:MAG: hypothetical protein AAB631_02205 [Patescibacteria group bacterium]
MKRIPKKYLIVAGLALMVLITPSVTHAVWPFGSVTDIVIGAFKILAYILNFIFSVLFQLAAFLVDVMLNINQGVLGKGNTIVTVGWPIVRDIANLGFVIVIIIIAVSTIVRYRDYAAKKLLPKLIAAAIIVNFSLPLMAVFVNFSNTITNFFIKQTTTGTGVGPSGLTGTLADAFGPQKFLIGEEDPAPPNPAEEEGALTSLTVGALSSVAGLVFTMVFTLLATFVFLAFAFLLLLRFLHLSFLAILSPLVWLFWVFPPLSSQYSKWWHDFMKWTFFAPASTFFMFLSIASVKQLAKLAGTGGAGMSSMGGAAAGGFLGGVLGGIMQQGVQMIIVAGVMLGGLIVADKMGIEGAGAAVKMAKDGGKGLRKYAGARTKALYQKRVAQTEMGQKLATGAGKLGGRLQKLEKGFDTKNMKGWRKIAAVASNVTTSALGIRPYDAKKGGVGATLKGAEKYTKNLALQEKINPGSVMGNMLTSAGIFKEKEKPKEKLSATEQEKAAKRITDATEQQGYAGAGQKEINKQRDELHAQIDPSNTTLVDSELNTLHDDLTKIDAAISATKDKDQIERLTEQKRVTQSQIGTLQNKIQDSDSANEEAQRIHKTATNYTDPREREAQLRKMQGKLEGPAIEEEIDRVTEESNDKQKEINVASSLDKPRLEREKKALEYQEYSLMDRRDKEHGKPETAAEAKAQKKEIAALRDKQIENKMVPSSAYDEKIKSLDAQIRRFNEEDKKLFLAEKKWETHMQTLKKQRDQYIGDGNKTQADIKDAEIKKIEQTIDTFQNIRVKKPKGAAEWDQRVKDLANQITSIQNAGILDMTKPEDIAMITELQNAASDAQDELKKKQGGGNPPPGSTPPTP